MNFYIVKYQRIVAHGLTSLLFIISLAYSGLVSAGAEVSSGDKAVLYPNASVEYKELRVSEVHQFLISTPKRISNALQIEDEVVIAGERTDILLAISSRGNTKKAFLFYQDLFNQKGEVIYSCLERACGSSSYWANTIYKENKLYGRDGDQYYVAGRLMVGGQKYFVSAYVVQNGRRQGYIYLSYILDTVK